jgi:tetratricopeptide (TPR) repeat protein
MTDLTAPQIAELEQRARANLQQDRFDEAVQDYEQLCHACPQDPALWHHLGVAYGGLGDANNAVRCARQTTVLAPGVSSGFRNLGHFQLQLGRAAEAEASFRSALLLSGGEAGDLGNLGAALAAQQRYDEAIDCYEQAIEHDANNPALHFNLGAAFHATARWADAVRGYQAASRLAPAEPRYLAGLAMAHRANGDDKQALAAWMQVLRLAPQDVTALRDVAAICHAHGQLVAAAEHYQRATHVEPDNPGILMSLGLVQLDLGNTDQAVACFRRILQRDPRDPPAQYNLALALERCGQLDESLAAYEQVAPGAHGLDIPGARASVLEKQGNFAAAHAVVVPVIQSGSAGMRALDVYARLCRHFDECDRAVELLEARLQSGVCDETEQRHMHFRLGELLDRQQRYDAAFRHYEAGNRMKHYSYNVADDARYIDRLVAALSPGSYAHLPEASVTSGITPIFIIGMPRSGSTLIEQILGSHPEVHAGDELPFMTRMANAPRACAGGKLGYPDYLPYLAAADCNEMATAYLRELQQLAPSGVRFVTDKLPHNFAYLALIHRLFPCAPIIHSLRDPADVCLSCYFQDFATYHNYAYDLAHLGQHYRQYQRIMAHYSDILQLPVLELRYESLVDEPEAQTRALLEFCGLDWDESCLRFYESGRRSRTASYDQVRQPLYKRSAQRWRNYEQFLQPLFDALAGK